MRIYRDPGESDISWNERVKRNRHVEKSDRQRELAIKTDKVRAELAANDNFFNEMFTLYPNTRI